MLRCTGSSTNSNSSSRNNIIPNSSGLSSGRCDVSKRFGR